MLCYVDPGLQLAKTREHVSARVLSATTKEDEAEKDATIKLAIDSIMQGNQGGEGTLEKADATGENVNGEDDIDVDDNDGKLAKSSHDSIQEPLVKVGDIFSSWFVCCFSVQFVSFTAAFK
jgi:alpha-1,4-galacturonosyltransferase